ncbi:MAG TPA: hypothetical protein G4O13_05395 [Dehalococcoidia bacterium]|nr:hypothetical protein [Dehalococcoidia bacterium]
MEISVDRIEVSASELCYRLRVPRAMRKYFLRDISYVRYDSAIDLEKSGESILAIPIVSMVAPIAWAVGADVRIRELDAAYLEALIKLRDILRDIYPRFSYSGSIHIEKAVVNTFGGSRAGLLFSGGVDSLTSYLRHKDEKPDLIVVRGIQVTTFADEFWDGLVDDVRCLADRGGVTVLNIETDMLQNTNFELLSREFGVDWYGDVAENFCMLGVCAPLTAARDIGSMYIAATYSTGAIERTMAHPQVDSNMAWADVRVVHDGYDLSRQQKIGYIRRSGSLDYLSKLSVCRENLLGQNCGKCEKCMWTITNMVVEGIDPNDCNFHIDGNTFKRIKDNFLKGRMEMSPFMLYWWGDIQQYVPEQIENDIHGSREFLEWFREYDLSQYRTNRVRRFLWTALLLYRNRRIKVPAVKRKVKCYYYIVLSRLGLA